MYYKKYNEILFNINYTAVPHTVPTFNTLVYVTVKFYWGGDTKSYQYIYVHCIASSEVYQFFG